MGLSQIKFFDFIPMQKQQKPRLIGFDSTLVFVIAAHSVHILLML